jgi:hypothetical protein
MRFKSTIPDRDGHMNHRTTKKKTSVWSYLFISWIQLCISKLQDLTLIHVALYLLFGQIWVSKWLETLDHLEERIPALHMLKMIGVLRSEHINVGAIQHPPQYWAAIIVQDVWCFCCCVIFQIMNLLKWQQSLVIIIKLNNYMQASLDMTTTYSHTYICFPCYIKSSCHQLKKLLV